MEWSLRTLWLSERELRTVFLVCLHNVKVAPKVHHGPMSWSVPLLLVLLVSCLLRWPYAVFKTSRLVMSSTLVIIKGTAKVNCKGEKEVDKKNIIWIILLKLEILPPYSTGENWLHSSWIYVTLPLYFHISRRCTPLFPCPCLRLRQSAQNSSLEIVVRGGERACVFDMGAQLRKCKLAESTALPRFGWPEFLPYRGSRWQQSDAKGSFLYTG